MMKIIIGSKNRAKVAAVKKAFHKYDCAIIAVEVASRVSKQPLTDEETVTGALNRAKGALLQQAGQIGIGLEGGVVRFRNDLYVCNWGALVCKNISEPIIAGGARFKLPKQIATQIYAGQELGPVLAKYVYENKLAKDDGAVGVFTKGLLGRTDMYFQIVKLLIGQYYFQTDNCNFKRF